MQRSINYCAIIIIFIASGVTAQSLMFEEPLPYELASAAGEIVSADFNADGFPDLAIKSQSVSILLNNGDGTFQPEIVIEFYGPSFSIFAAELNGDDFPDIAIATYGVESLGLSVYVNNGDGTFQNHGDYAVPPYARVVTGGDFDADGDTDLSVMHYHYEKSNFQAVMFFNNGDGSFVQGNTYPTGPAPEAAAPNDLDGNGFCDFATADHFAVVLYMSNGDGTFSMDNLSTTNSMLSISAADLDGNGSPDIAATEWPDLLHVFFNNGDGTFAVPVSYQEAGSIDGVSAGDLDDDGDNDLALASPGTNEVLVYYNDGLGAFPEPVKYPFDTSPNHVCLADLDGDQDNDLAVSCGINTIFILMNRTYPYITGDANRDGSINVGDVIYIINYVFKFGPPPIPIAAGDANEDGLVNIADAVYLIEYVF